MCACIFVYDGVGVCCDPNSETRACCAITRAHPACLDEDYQPTDVLCPNKEGLFAPCCTAEGDPGDRTPEPRCKQEFDEIVMVDAFEYHFDPTSYGPDTQSSQVMIHYNGVNKGAKLKAVGSITDKVSFTQTTRWEFESETELSLSTTFKTGIPFITKGKFSLGGKQIFKKGDSGSRTEPIGVDIDTGGNTIAPFSRQQFQFKAQMTVFTVPFTAIATKRNQCGDTRTDTISGSARISGVASFATGHFTKVIGPAVPIECKSPFNTPIKMQRKKDFCPKGGSKTERMATGDNNGMDGGIVVVHGRRLLRGDQ